ncbi:hypothetical protein BEWA_009690 [Theileria equi strain WA]|uniref:Uncharacterized protein n=1 Tax=Theileria equi strain WA TaxID=1537102 RepID=L0B157_THEEQ|nr:hypothetical protein BEWA_009690 [Theileria equi strain WA]AFZ81555.1 hypothetical protein BEWA_009690 [Theileria equi strain WA]|eukprot:XP_004831221.1 hypothetical protein BEWA_009690 [Theileria equi strain WA]
MVDISHESLICSDLNENMELIRLHTDSIGVRPVLDNSIMIDGYKEISKPGTRRRRRRRSSSVHSICTKMQDDRDHSINTFETIYKKIAAFFFVFNKFANANDFINNLPVIANESHTLSFVRSFNMLYDLRIKEKIYDTMDNFMKSNRSATDRIVAMIPTMPINLDALGISKYFTGNTHNIADCFALFIENPRISGEEDTGISDSKPLVNSDLDSIPTSIRCEIVNKLSQEVLSECGTYECLYEQEIDSLPENIVLDGMLKGMPISKGKIRFFHKIMTFGKRDGSPKPPRKRIDGTVDDSAGFLKQRFSIFTEYLSRRNCDVNPGGSNKWNAKTYFNIFSKKEGDYRNPMDLADDSAKERFEEHIRMHTAHWDEIQYDDIEIVLRDNNDNSIIKLPYSCTIM